MKAHYRILDFRNRPPLPPYKAIFDLKLTLLNNPLKRELAVMWFRWLSKTVFSLGNRGAATVTPSMKMVGQPEAMNQWWREVEDAGIVVVVSVGRLTDDRGCITAEELSDLQRQYPKRF